MKMRPSKSKLREGKRKRKEKKSSMVRQNQDPLLKKTSGINIVE
jgi:hypothetical protein